MLINNEAERKSFLELNIKGMGSYALVTYANHTEAIWITRYEKWDVDGDWFLEAPCELHKYKYNYDLTKQEDLDFIKEYGMIIKDNNVYEIDSPQVAPFLPGKLDDLTLISEELCLNWILKQNSK